MPKSYVALRIRLDPSTSEFVEILTALLDNYAFEGIIETETDFIAYVPSGKFVPAIPDKISTVLKAIGCTLEYSSEIVPEKNWNELWESNFEPVVIANRCVIRAPFHDSYENFPVRITIEPKMSFGTGHHETTRLMVEQMLLLEFKEKKVLDMGCGTGVLGILASLLGAAKVYCIDTDAWARDNALENICRNNVTNIAVIHGGKEAIPDEKFEIVLANINRNIIIDQMPKYERVLTQDGLLVISGFLEEDMETINQTAVLNNFRSHQKRLLNKWMLMLCERI